MDEDVEAGGSSSSRAAAATSPTREDTENSASICITPLSGAQTGSTRALCHLLEFDDAKILLDCGINAHREELSGENYTQDRVEYLNRLKECVSL